MYEFVVVIFKIVQNNLNVVRGLGNLVVLSDLFLVERYVNYQFFNGGCLLGLGVIGGLVVLFEVGFGYGFDQ